MTDTVQSTTPMDESETYFGVCPECRRHDGFLNFGRAHWFICRAHKVRWCAGENLFSDWKDETEEQWNENAELLSTMTEVKPFYPPEHHAEYKPEPLAEGEYIAAGRRDDSELIPF